MVVGQRRVGIRNSISFKKIHIWQEESLKLAGEKIILVVFVIKIMEEEIGISLLKCLTSMHRNIILRQASTYWKRREKPEVKLTAKLNKGVQL